MAAGRPPRASALLAPAREQGPRFLGVLAEADVDAHREPVFLAAPDEEIGSPAGRAVTERVTRRCDVALVLERARENGDLVVAREGVADIRVTVTGTAAHAGTEPERGANAALAAAHPVVALRGLPAIARRPGDELGIDVRGTAATGGVGDANLIAGLGTPVLDGLGPVGGADHTPGEWLDLGSAHARVTLIAALIATPGDGRA